MVKFPENVKELCAKLVKNLLESRIEGVNVDLEQINEMLFCLLIDCLASC